MERDQISSSSDEFDYAALDDDLTLNSGGLPRETNESSKRVRRRKIRKIIKRDSEVESDLKREVESEDHDEVLPNAQFIPSQSPTAPRIDSNVQQPIDFFKLFFTNDLAKKIISETNRCAKRKFEEKTPSAFSIWRNWRDVADDEFWAFLAVVINMGTMPLANLQEYWSQNAVSRIPFYSDTFARDRFSQIFWMLRLETMPTRAANPRTRVSSFLDYLNSKLLDYFVPGEHVRVDESTIKSKGRISFVARNPQKPTKWGVRVYALADAKTGYVCCILPYYGSLTAELLVRPDLPHSSRIPIHLYQMLLEKIPGAQGHRMYADRHYANSVLAEELAKLKCSLTITEELPKDIKKPKFSTKSTVAPRRGDDSVLGWRDKGIVTSTYCFLRKSLKWWRKLFFWGMEISLLNSYLLYKLEKTKRRERPLSHLRFLQTLVEQLRGSYRRQREQAATSASRSDEIRLNGKLHVLLKGPKRDCKVCSDRSTPGARRSISYYCDTCPDKPRMHLGDCFTKYHTKTNYRA